ncbi:GNAT family N-acetyltransferase [Planosporangium mesophilum]|uniref:GNAT family N-acetyltransferase n=1 Tax=Planosporangium mesophilum TaxID=689768 RepID=UPI00143902C6|nr:GNAT family N-acetyltransferase [Planosporangium mesophilum]NJC81988.1 GNAT family N-acetyltransferase [Planosporangium mesophilum]
MTVTLRAMTEDELEARIDDLVDEYALDLHRSRGLPLDRARTEAQRQTADLLPDGVATTGTLMFTAEAGGAAVGWIWLSLSTPHQPGSAWIYEITVDAEHRGKGYGRALIRAAEDELARRGVTRLALNVFSHNTAAIRLYESVGFHTTSLQMAKSIGPAAEPAKW